MNPYQVLGVSPGDSEEGHTEKRQRSAIRIPTRATGGRKNGLKRWGRPTVFLQIKRKEKRMMKRSGWQGKEGAAMGMWGMGVKQKEHR